MQALRDERNSRVRLAAPGLERIGRLQRGAVGTTKCSEQNHNPKEKGFKLKEYSRLKSHESLSEYDSKTGITFVLALRPIGAVAWESPFQLAHYNWL